MQANTPYISLHWDFHTQTRAKAEARSDKSYSVILFYEQLMIKVDTDLTENKLNMALTQFVFSDVLQKKTTWSNTERNTSCQTSQLPHIPSLISENNRSTLCTLSDFCLYQPVSAVDISFFWITLLGYCLWRWRALPRFGGHVRIAIQQLLKLPELLKLALPRHTSEVGQQWVRQASGTHFCHTIPVNRSAQVLVHSLPGATGN